MPYQQERLLVWIELIKVNKEIKALISNKIKFHCLL
jgi:hypothetical protein